MMCDINIRRVIMKYVTRLILAVLIFGLTACMADDEDDTKESPDTNSMGLYNSTGDAGGKWGEALLLPATRRG
jgi:hypothetical protein